MNLNHHGQAFTLSRKLYDKGVRDAEGMSALMRREKGDYTFAHPFPTGTHAMWTYYWLAAYGIHPFQDVWTGQEIDCPNPDCRGPLKINTFVVEQPG